MIRYTVVTSWVKFWCLNVSAIIYCLFWACFISLLTSSILVIFTQDTSMLLSSTLTYNESTSKSIMLSALTPNIWIPIEYEPTPAKATLERIDSLDISINESNSSQDLSSNPFLFYSSLPQRVYALPELYERNIRRMRYLIYFFSPIKNADVQNPLSAYLTFLYIIDS